MTERRGRVTWFDELLGESVNLSHFTKNTFIHFDGEDEERAAFRRERSAPACALAARVSFRHTATELDEIVSVENLGVPLLTKEVLKRQGASRSRGRSNGSSRCSSRFSRGRSSGHSCGRSSGRSRETCGRSSGRSNGPRKRRSLGRSTHQIIGQVECGESEWAGGRLPPRSRVGSKSRWTWSSGQSSRRSSAQSSRQSSKNGKSSGRSSGRSSGCGKALKRGSTDRSATKSAVLRTESAAVLDEKPSKNDVVAGATAATSQQATSRANPPKPPPGHYEVQVSNRFAALEHQESQHVNARQGDASLEPEDMDTGADEPRSKSTENVPTVSFEPEPATIAEPIEEPASDQKHVDASSQPPHDSASSAQTVLKTKPAKSSKSKRSKAKTSQKGLTVEFKEDDVAELAQVSEQAAAASKPEPPAKEVGKEAGSKVKSCQAEASKVGLTQADMPDCIASAEGPQVTGKQAELLALLAIRLNEYCIAVYLKEQSAPRLIVTTLVNPRTIEGQDMLKLEPGDVVHCEAVDASGWGFGTIVAPTRLAGQRGCFRCEGMLPVVAELRHQRGEHPIVFTRGDWQAAEALTSAKSTQQQRMRQKAMWNRVKIARAAWDQQQLAKKG